MEGSGEKKWSGGDYGGSGKYGRSDSRERLGRGRSSRIKMEISSATAEFLLNMGLGDLSDEELRDFVKKAVGKGEGSKWNGNRPVVVIKGEPSVKVEVQEEVNDSVRAAVDGTALCPATPPPPFPPTPPLPETPSALAHDRGPLACREAVLGTELISSDSESEQDFGSPFSRRQYFGNPSFTDYPGKGSMKKSDYDGIRSENLELPSSNEKSKIRWSRREKIRSRSRTRSRSRRRSLGEYESRRPYFRERERSRRSSRSKETHSSAPSTCERSTYSYRNGGNSERAASPVCIFLPRGLEKKWEGRKRNPFHFSDNNRSFAETLSRQESKKETETLRTVLNVSARFWTEGSEGIEEDEVMSLRNISSSEGELIIDEGDGPVGQSSFTRQLRGCQDSGKESGEITDDDDDCNYTVK